MKRTSLRKAISRVLSVILMTGVLTAGFAVADTTGNGIAFAESGDADISAIAVGDHIYAGRRDPSGFTGLPYWRVIDKDLEDGSVFLMSEYLWTGNDTEDFLQFNEIAAEGVPMEGYEDLGYMSKGSAWQGSMAQNWCQNFETAVLSSVRGMTIKAVTKTDEEFPSPDDKDVTFAWTKNILNGDKVFFLSGEEAVRYMPTKDERYSYLHDGNTVGERCDYWLRSPRLYTFSECAGKVLAYGGSKGAVARQVVSSLGAARPAFWAKFSADTRFVRCEHKGVVTWTIDPESGKHGYSDFVYKWSSDNKKCTASAVCNNCGLTVNETASSSSKVTKPAKVLEDGIRTYTTVFSNAIFTTCTKQVSIPKTYDPVTGAPNSKLPKLSLKKTDNSKKKVLRVSWKKLSSSKKKKISGIEIQYGTDSKFKNKPLLKKAGKTKTSYTIKKLKSKKYYWVRIRTYKNKGGIKYVSSWTKAKKVRVR